MSERVAVILVMDRNELGRLPAGVDHYFATIPEKSDAPMATTDDVKAVLNEKLDKLLEAKQ